MNKERTHHDLCPAKLAWALDLGIRKWLQNPAKILAPYISEGDKAIDVGCGPGFFTSELARLVGDSGKVFAVDIQAEMLEMMKAKLTRCGLVDRVVPCLADGSGFHIPEPCDFALAFYVVHEVPDQDSLFKQVYDSLRSGGVFLVVEPKLHVKESEVLASTEKAKNVGFSCVEIPQLRLNRSILLKKP